MAKLIVYERPDKSIIYSGCEETYLGGVFVDDPNSPLYGEDLDPTSPTYGQQIVTGFEQRELTMSDHPRHPEAEGLPYIVIDEEDLPIDLNNGDHLDMMFFNGAVTLENFTKDAAWDQHLMPIPLLQAEDFERTNRKIDEELDKPSPDPIVLMSLGRRKEKIKDWTPLETYTAALAALDEKVAGGGADKPTIRALLNARIADLTP